MLRRYRMKKEKEKMAAEYENEILELIDYQEDYTRSDLQGIVAALVAKIIRESSADFRD